MFCWVKFLIFAFVNLNFLSMCLFRAYTVPTFLSILRKSSKASDEEALLNFYVKQYITIRLKGKLKY